MTCLSKHSHGTLVSWSHGGVRAPPKALAPFCPIENFVKTAAVPAPGLPAAHKHCDITEDNCINSFSHEIVWEEAHEIANLSNRARKRLHRQHAVNVKNSIVASSSMLEAADVISVAASGNHLTAAQKLSLKNMLKAHTKAFAVDSNDLGRIVDAVEIVHEIDTGDASPCAQQPYKLSHHEKMFLREQLRQLLKQGVIRRSKSPWMAPVVLVKRKDGALRTCIDFRKLNKQTLRDAYPLPNIEDMMHDMSGAKYFSSLDVMSAFWNVPVAEKDIPKTGFTTPFGNFEWVRMPFGLVNASSTFQRLINKVLADLPFAVAYIDDIFVFSDSFEEHIDHLQQVLKKLQEAGLKLKLAKCAFAATSIKCLGNIIDAEGIHADPDKIAAIKNLPRPLTPSDVRSFLGTANYYRAFVKDFAHLMLPLQELTKKRTRFLWTDECEQAFIDIKEALTSTPCLHLPKWDQPFIVHSDWSKGAIGAVLSQLDPKTGLEHPIHFASRSLSAAERNYAPTEGECLALVWAVQKFRTYLHGHRFVVHTDHASLQWLNNARFTNSKLERWALRLQEHDFTVAYKKGSENLVADALSRLVSTHAMQFLAQDHIVACPASVDRAVQKVIDAEPCTICKDPDAHDNMVICDGCDRMFHLRCLMPPQSTVPSGSWLCPACQLASHSDNLQELFDENTPLSLHDHDPYACPDLLAFVAEGGDPASLPEDTNQRRSLLHRSKTIRMHPSIPGWLLVNRSSRDGNFQWRVCPPLEYRWDIVRVMHDHLCHSGIEQTLTMMRQHYHWPGIKSDIHLVIQCCDACQRRKLIYPEGPALQEPFIIGPLEHVHIDLAGPFPLPHKHHYGAETAYIQLMIDYFTKVAEFAIIPSKHPHETAHAFYMSWVCRYGVPSVVTTDNGTEFKTGFSVMLHRLNVKHVHTSTEHPAANGAVERLVQSMKSMLASHVNGHRKAWPDSLSLVRAAHMSRIHSVTGFSPHELLMGFQPRLPSDAQVLLGAMSAVQAQNYVDRLQDSLARKDAEAYDAIKRRFSQNASDWTARRKLQHAKVKVTPLQVGDYVLELDASQGPLQAKAKGPYKIVALRHNNCVALLQTGKTYGRDTERFDKHVSRLVRYYFKPSVPLS